MCLTYLPADNGGISPWISMNRYTWNEADCDYDNLMGVVQLAVFISFHAHVSPMSASGDET
jgi:hypothetical protein